MTREEALQQLEGTWDFTLENGMYRIRDVALLADIARHENATRPEPVRQPAKPVVWAAQVTQYGLA